MWQRYDCQNGQFQPFLTGLWNKTRKQQLTTLSAILHANASSLFCFYNLHLQLTKLKKTRPWTGRTGISRQHQTCSVTLTAVIFWVMPNERRALRSISSSPKTLRLAAVKRTHTGREREREKKKNWISDVLNIKAEALKWTVWNVHLREFLWDWKPLCQV